MINEKCDKQTIVKILKIEKHKIVLNLNIYYQIYPHNKIIEKYLKFWKFRKIHRWHCFITGIITIPIWQAKLHPMLI